MDFIDKKTKDERVGAKLTNRNPKCEECNHYMHEEYYQLDVENPVKWLCPGCGCAYEKLND